MSGAHAISVFHFLAVCLVGGLLIVWAGCSRSGGAALLTPKEFTKEIAIALRARAAPDVLISVPKDLEIDLATKAYPKISCDLGRAYADYQRNPGHKGDIVEHWVAFNLEQAARKPAGIDTGHIIPLVRNRAYLKSTADALRAKGMGADPDFVYDDLNDDLIVLYAENADSGVHFIHPADIRDAGIDRKDLRRLACGNLSRAMPQILSSGGKGINIFMTDKDLAASLLVLENFWNKDQMHVKGDIVVGVPGADCLIVTGSDDPECLKIARKTVAEQYAKASRPVSEKLYVLRGGHFSEFTETQGADIQPK